MRFYDSETAIGQRYCLQDVRKVYGWGGLFSTLLHMVWVCNKISALERIKFHMFHL